MTTDEAYVKLAERGGHADSKLLHRILEKAMTPEEASRAHAAAAPTVHLLLDLAGRFATRGGTAA